MSLNRQPPTSGYPDVSEREGIHQLRKGDVLVDPTVIPVDEVRAVAMSVFTNGVELKTRIERSDSEVVDTVVVDKDHLVWENPNTQGTNPVTTVGQVVSKNKELARLAVLSETARTEFVVNKIWERLNPILEKEFSTPEQVEAFLRNENGMVFPAEILEGVAVDRSMLAANWDSTVQEEFDGKRNEWLYKTVFGAIKKKFAAFMIAKWNIVAKVPRWTSYSDEAKRNKLCKGDILLLGSQPYKSPLNRGEDRSVVIQRNFPAWISESLQVYLCDNGSLRFYLPTFIPDFEWDNTSKKPSHYKGFIDLSVTDVKTTI